MKKRIAEFFFFILSGIAFNSCTLDSACDLIEGYHYGSGDECVKDTDDACGNSGPGWTPVNCNRDNGAKEGKCVNGQCMITKCMDEDKYFLEENKCVPFTLDICNSEKGLHLSSEGKCVNDTDELCGNAEVNCKTSDGALDGECVKGKCRAKTCDPDWYFPDPGIDGKCIAYTMETCNSEKSLHFNKKGKCVSDQNEECGSILDDCTKPEYGLEGYCSEGVCVPKGDCINNFYQVDPITKKCILKNELSCAGNGMVFDPDDGVCIEKCDCDINTQCKRERACEIEWCSRNDTICLKSAEDLELLRDEGMSNKKYVYLLNDINLADRKGGCENWDIIPELRDMNFLTFGSEQKKITASKGGERCKLSSGLFKKIVNTNMSNINIDIDVTGENVGGGLAEIILQSDLFNVSYSGTIEDTDEEEIDEEDKCEVDACSDEKCSGVGGLSGRIEDSVLRDTVCDDVTVKAPGMFNVGGLTGVMCSTRVENSDVKHQVKALYGNLNVGGYFGYADKVDISDVQNIVKEEIVGKKYVGGFVGRMNKGSILFRIENKVTGRVKGHDIVGGFSGEMNGFIQDVKNEVKEVIGIDVSETDFHDGFGVGETCQKYNDSCTDNECEEEKDTKIGDDIGGFSGIVGESGYIDGFNNKIGDSVKGCDEVGGFTGLMVGKVDDKSDNETGNIVNKVYGKENVGGFCGEMKYGSTISNVKNDINSIITFSWGGGFGGRVNGTITNIDNTVKIIKVKVSAGGVAFSIDNTCYVSNVINNVELISGDSVGGFSCEMDGIVKNSVNIVKVVEGHKGVSGAFNGIAGTVENFRNNVKKVIGRSCDEINKYQRNGICEKKYESLNNQSDKVLYKLAGYIVSGFARSIDTEFDENIVDIINRVEGVYGNDMVSGFISYHGGYYFKTQVHTNIENISSYANVYLIGIGEDLEWKGDSGGFVGNEFFSGASDVNSIFTQNLENVVSMSRVYKLNGLDKISINNGKYFDDVNKNDFISFDAGNVYGVARMHSNGGNKLNTSDDFSLDDQNPSTELVHGSNFYYYKYHNKAETGLTKRFIDEGKLKPIQSFNSKKDFDKYLTILNKEVANDSRYGLRWCVKEEKVGDSEKLLMLTLYDRNDQADKNSCL